jgi:hypothetical protein
MKTAILIHGEHVQAHDWEHIVWGNPTQGVYGKVPKGLIEGLRWDADLLIFGTGASEKDGLKEGAFTLAYTQEHIGEIPEFKEMGIDVARKIVFCGTSSPAFFAARSATTWSTVTLISASPGRGWYRHPPWC